MTAVTERIDEAPSRRFRPYPEYMDSGVDWLGEIPASWEVQPLKHLATFSTGWTPPTGREELYGGEHLWANISDLGPRVLNKTEKTISDAAIQEARLRIVDAGSLLFSFKLSVGRVSIAGVNMYTNEAIAAFSPSSLIDTGYLFWAAPVLIPRNAQDNIYGAPLLNGERIANAKLLRPIPSDQRAIAAFLDRETAKVDALVARNERLIELLQEKRSALITRAVTRGLDPNVPIKDSGVEWLGEIPVHWDVKRVKWIARMESGHTPDKKVDAYWKDGDIPWVSLNDTRHLKDHDYINDTEYYTNELGLKNSSARLLAPRSVVFSRDATIGLCAITERAMAVSQHFIAWICSEDVIPEYLLRVFDAMQGELERLAMGATLRTIGMPEVNTLATPVPPVDEQEVIVNHIHQERLRLDLLIAKIHEAINLLKEFRSALISAAVTGKIDLRHASAEATSSQGGTP